MNENVMIKEDLIAENADFLKAVAGAKTIEEARKICTEYNQELPEDVWNEVQAACRNGELSEEDLDGVAGGFSGENLLKTLGGIAGLGAAIAAGAPAGVLLAVAWIGYHGYRTFR